MFYRSFYCVLSGYLPLTKPGVRYLNSCSYPDAGHGTGRSKACTVVAHLEAGIVGSNPTQGMGFWYVYIFILYLCYPVFR
jgi:hypothetical protein